MLAPTNTYARPPSHLRVHSRPLGMERMSKSKGRGERPVLLWVWREGEEWERLERLSGHEKGM